jgi:Fe-S cluster assembly ATP-binding protein
LAEPLLEIDQLCVSVGNQEILRGCSLTVARGEVAAIMGPNGSGKSTLSKVIAGHPAYQVTGGSIRVAGRDLSGLAPEERARLGIFVGFQYPVEVPGVSNSEFLRLAVNARRGARSQPQLDAKGFAPVLEAAIAQVEFDHELKDRQLNAGFSGGQKKRNEILQMVLLEPQLAILDETDSGLDIDALRAVARGINGFRSPERGIVLITHYQRLLELVVPDRVHVFADGRVIRSGDRQLASDLERRGYDGLDGR